MLYKKYRIKSKFRFTLFLVIIILTSIFITSNIFGFNEANSLTRVDYYEIDVEAGDTLWQLAEEYMNNGKDTRENVYELCEINNIAADQLKTGNTILIPNI